MYVPANATRGSTYIHMTYLVFQTLPIYSLFTLQYHMATASKLLNMSMYTLTRVRTNSLKNMYTYVELLAIYLLLGIIGDLRQTNSIIMYVYSSSLFDR